MEEADEFCPYCDNHFVIEVAEQTSMPMIALEGDDPRLIRDQRMPQKNILEDLDEL